METILVKTRTRYVLFSLLLTLLTGYCIVTYMHVIFGSRFILNLMKPI